LVLVAQVLFLVLLSLIMDLTQYSQQLPQQAAAAEDLMVQELQQVTQAVQAVEAEVQTLEIAPQEAQETQVHTLR
jgi:hypothetical protein